MHFRTTCLLLPSLFLALAASAQTSPLLRPGSVRTFYLDKAGRQTFRLKPEPGKHYRIEAEQRGIDIRLQLAGAGGVEIANQDAPNGMYGPELIEFDAGGDSALLLTITPLPDPANAVRGKVSLVLREAGAADPAIANGVLTPRRMQRDLRVFRQIREQANSGFLRYRSAAFMDSLYAGAMARTNRPMPLTEFYKIIMELTDAEGSCHNNTTLPGEVLDYLPKDRGFFPYSLKRVGGQMLVNNAGGAIPLGARILSINGMRDTAIMQRFFKYLPTDGYNRSAKLRFSVDNSFGWRYPLEFGVQDSFRILYQLPGAQLPAAITILSIGIGEKRQIYAARHSAPAESYFDSDAGPAYSASMRDSTTALLRFRRFDMAGNADDPAYAVFCAFLDSVFSTLRVRRIPNLIIDVRNNPGGNDPNYEKVFTYLTDRPFRENTLAYTNFGALPLPQYYRWSSSYPDNQKRENAELNALFKELFAVPDGARHLQTPANNPVYYPDTVNRFEGNLYLLIDENVASAASHFASLVCAYSKARVVGVETTGGYYGHNGHFPVEYVLPESKIRTRFSIVWVEQDARQLPSQPVGRGIIPDVEVHQSYADFMANEDTQLKAVMRMIGARGTGR